MKKTFLVLFTAVAFAVNAFAQAFNPQPYANQIDAELNKQYSTITIKPQPLINEDQFVRRAYLSIIGRNPTYAEYQQYQTINAANKKAELVRYLVNSKGFTSNLYNYWAEFLRTRDRINNVNFLSGEPYIAWVKDSIQSNKPYNQFVKELLTAEGDYYTNPQTGLYERDLGMPLDNLIGITKNFEGIDISCAQCHDDPFQEWSQTQFYQMAALFSQGEPTGRRNPAARDKIKQIREEIENLVKNDVKLHGLNNQVSNFLGATLVSVNVDPKKQLRYPFDYRYKDHTANEVVKPAVMIGDYSIKNTENMRLDAAEWMTSPNHPSFTKNVVNRYWGIVFGSPIVRNVNNLYANEKINSPLMNTLANIFVSLNYDTKKFFQVLCATQLFQRADYTGPVNDNFVFIGPVFHRLSAEQIWDSIIALVVDEPEYFSNKKFVEDYKAIMNITDFDGLNLQQVREKIDQIQELNKHKYDGAQNYKGFFLVRASEVNDNGADNTVLAQLGRSDRELIGTSTREGNVTQVISLLNGALVDIATKKDSAIDKTIKSNTGINKMDIVFKAVLSRSPTISERAHLQNFSQEDLIWALINTQEFKFN